MGDAGTAAPPVTPAPYLGPDAQPATTTTPVEQPRQDWYRAVRSVRSRILASYVILIALSAAVAILGVRSLLFSQLENRVSEALEQEVHEFDQLARGIDPETGERWASVTALFDTYLARNVPSQEEALLGFVDGEFYRSALAQFPLDRLPSENLADWESRSSRAPGEAESAVGRFDTSLGEAHFRARRVRIGDSTGALIVTILPAGRARRHQRPPDLRRRRRGRDPPPRLGGGVVRRRPRSRAGSPADRDRPLDLGVRPDAAHQDRGQRRGRRHGTSFNHMLDRLESVFRSQREFVQDASHELRDPLTICRGHLELLGDDPEERRATTALVLDELDRMGRIVDDLQLLAEAEHPDFLRREWIDFELLTHELVAKANALAPRRWTLDSVGTGTVFADRQRLTEAVMNLAHNAVQHTVAHDSIAIGTSSTPSEARIWVRDSGSGVAVEDQAKIFERFKRGGDAHRRYRGGGLGLAIVKSIAETHGGSVELESRLGEGSLFTIVLPIETEHRSSWWPGS